MEREHNGFSFVISYESRNGPGFHGQTGFMASWRPIHHQKTSAITIGGSPFKTLAEAEEACKVMLSQPPGEIGIAAPSRHPWASARVYSQSRS